MKNSNNIKWYQSTSFKLSWIYIFTFIPLIMFSFFINTYNQSKVQDELLEKYATGILESISLITTNSIISENYYPAIEHCLNVIDKTEGINYIVIDKTKDPDFIPIIINKDSWNLDQSLKRISKDVKPQSQNKITDIFVQTDSYHIYSKITYSSMDWGHLHIGFSSKLRDDMNKTSLRDNVIIGIVSVLFALVVIFIVSKKLTKPLSDIYYLSDEVISGNYKNRISITSNDEVGLLVKNINRMIDSIEKNNYVLEESIENKTKELKNEILEKEKYQNELNELNENLEKTIKERSNELVDTLNLLKKEVQEKRLNEINLQKSERRYKQFIYNSPNPVFTIDRNMNISSFNISFMEMINPDNKEFSFRLKDIFKNESDYHSIQSRLSFQDKADLLTNTVITFVGLDGKEQILNSVIYPLLDSSDNIEGYVITGINETEKILSEKKHKISEKNYRNIYKSSPLVIAIFDSKGNCTEINGKVKDWLDYDPEEIIGINIGNFPIMSRNQKVLGMRFIKDCGNEDTIDLEFLAKDKSIHVGRMSASKYLDETQNPPEDKFVIIIANITYQKEIEKKLIEDEKKLQAIFNQLQVGVLLIDSETNNIEMVNKMAEIMIGETREGILNQPGEKYIHEYRGSTDYANDDYDQTRSFEDILYDTDGKQIPILRSGIKMNLFDKEYILESFIDLTIQKETERELRASEERFKLIFDYAPDAYYLTDFKGRFVDANKTAEKLTGYNKEELLGISFLKTSFLSAKQIIRAAKLLAKNVAFLPTGPDEFTIKTKNGDIIPLDISTYPVKIKGKNLILGIARDISKRKVIEESLISARDEIQKALTKEKEISQLKSSFVSMISHEYRTPLTVILTSTYILERAIQINDNKNISKHLEMVRISVDQMTNMVENVLKIGKDEIQEPKLAKYDMIEVCTSIIKEIKSIHGTKNAINFESNTDKIECQTDLNLFRSVMINLLSNAIKYSPNGDEIDVKINDIENTIQLDVIDHGIGIPEIDQKHLFTTFHRASNVSNIKGTGLGLAIVKRSIEKLGGSISFESEVNKGTKFSLLMKKNTLTENMNEYSIN